MHSRSTLLTTLALGAAFCGAFAVAARADSVADFYSGKTITIYTGVGLGSSYGTNALLFANAFKTHVPGHPGVIATAMPGAGGAKMVNYLYNAAPKDGTYIGFPLKYIAVNQALGQKGLKYDAAKFNYIGSLGPINSVVAMWAAKSPVKTLAEAYKKVAIMGSSGKSSETYITPTLMNNLLGTKFKVVTGYAGTAPIHVAMEMGEVHGVAASWDSIKGDKPDWVKNKKVVLLAQSGTKRNWDLQDLPTLLDLAKTPEQKKILGFFANGNAAGWIMMLPPNVPKDRVAALRKAFDETMKDPAYLKGVKDRGMDIDPIDGAEVARLIKETLSLSPEMIEKAKVAMGM
jgi:tripartite-type tricarboxylate transporter receptor subunit TctC